MAPVVRALMREMKARGSLKGWSDRLIAFDDLTDILGLPDVKALERKHGIL